ncbi:MAG: chromosome segregation protein SMC [Candidatus Aureabacteria bacterium]|nr:chromosome segregation protein SMC [Candidatus Auribacterota bacterium]
MYLKKLDLNGFKSFADKTSLSILPGITSIVGPNGCGKTNVVDAISWVLGEQRARLLRGYRMEDVIFNGTDSRPPVSLAEVSLTFDNADGKLPIEFSEVAITRRLYRSGESEYLINRKICRLRDIQNLFLGTGLGSRSYSLIEQGRIDQILRSPPEERRALLEEAAGISKYRANKEEALRKLEITQNNLMRVEDIIREVKRQLSQAERQSRQAEAYRQCRDRLRDLEIRLGRIHLGRFRASAQEALAGKLQWQEKVQALEKEVQAVEAALASLRGTWREREDALGRRRAEVIRGQAELEKTRHRMEMNLDRIGELRKFSEQFDREKEETERTLVKERGELRTEEGILTELVARDGEFALRWEEKDAAMRELRRVIAAAETELAASRDRSLEASRLNAHAQNELLVLQGGGKDLVLRRRKLEVELEKLSAEEAELSGELHALAASGGEMERIARESAQEAEKRKAETERRETEVARLRQEAAQILLTIREKEGRREALAARDREEAEGDAGARALFAARQAGERTFPGLIGSVSEFLQIAPGYESAARAVLGDTLRALVVESWPAAQAVLAAAREMRAGSFRLLILSSLPVSEASLSPSLPGALREQVVFLPPLRGREGFLLQEAAVVSDLAAFSAAPASAAVTPSGETFFPPAIVHWPGETAPGAEKVEVLSSEIDELGRRDREKQAALSAESEALKTAREELDTALRRAREEEVKSALQRGEIDRWRKNLERTILTRDSVAADLASLRREGEALLGRSRECEVRLEESSGQEHEQAAVLTQSQEKLDGLLPRLKAEEAETIDLKIALASSREKKESAAARLRRLTEDIAAREALLRVRESRREEGAARSRELIAENDELERDQEEMKRLGAEAELALSTEEEAVKALRLSYEGKEREYHDLRPRFQELQGRLGEQETRLAELNLKEQSEIQRIRDKYELELDSLPPSAEDLDEEAIGLEIEKLRKKMEGMTDVNLGALQEKESYESRYKHLTEQKADLEGARADIEEAIKKINLTARERLRETYDRVRANFRTLFSELFQGGQADLILQDSADILDAGLEIVAQPPGKRLSHISLLSGGERAMTTIALIFALFMVQPSPFYILDEIDAPLDEANIGRFIILLKHLVKSSQFLIITHNKRSIREADILYGITMEESGVSKVVSVKLKERE